MRSLLNRAVPAIAVAGMVAALVLGTGALGTLRGQSTGPGAASGSTTSAGPSDTTELDRGGASLADVAACVGHDVAGAELLYGTRQRSLDDEGPVLVLRTADGLLLCDAFGPDRPAVAPVPVATVADPVRFLTTGRAEWSCRADRVLEGFRQSTWLSTSPEVATVEQRYRVDGVAGPWFSTAASHGFAHLQTWLDGPEPAGTTYRSELRALDADGAVVPQTELPTRPQALAGCPEGGSASIG